MKFSPIKVFDLLVCTCSLALLDKNVATTQEAEYSSLRTLKVI